MRRTSTRMADGRELIYFDADGAPDRALHDPRDLPVTESLSQVRFDPLMEEWVGIAAHRQNRTYKPATDACPLCPSRDGHETEIPSPDYDVVVFENRFPSFAQSAGDPYADLPAAGAAARKPGVGRCEVVCFTSDHTSSFSSLTPERARLVVDAWADRTAELSALPGVEQVFPFENRGEEIGVTLAHPHGQIYGYPFVTPRTRAQLGAARRHHQRTWRNLFADVLATEQAAGERVVTRGEHWTAFVPGAARWPFEVHLFPHRQVPDLPALTDAERDDFALVYLDVLRRFDTVFDSPMPYIAGWHQAPVHDGRELAYLHLELFSIRRDTNKIKYLAGSESGMGVFVNDIAPEQAAQRLRDAR